MHDSPPAPADLAQQPQINPDLSPVVPVRQQERVSSVDVLRGVALLGILLMNVVGFGLPHWAYDDPSVAGGSTGADFWTWAVNSVRQGYLHNVKTFSGIVMMLESSLFYKIFFFDVAGMMLIGMGLMKLGVFSATCTYRFYALLALLGYAYGVPAGIWVVSDWVRHGFEPGTRWLVLYDSTRLSVALGHIGLLMIVCKANVLGWLTRRLAAVGQMALTNYVMHTLVTITLFCGFGLGLFGQLRRHQLYYVVGAIWIFQLVASPIWLRHFQFGPLEWVWRSLTYKRRQPMTLRANEPSPAAQVAV